MGLKRGKVRHGSPVYVASSWYYIQARATGKSLALDRRISWDTRPYERFGSHASTVFALRSTRYSIEKNSRPPNWQRRARTLPCLRTHRAETLWLIHALPAFFD